MAREKKAQTIESLQGKFSRCRIGILTDYRGLKTTELTVLRRKLREASIDYQVVKNTLARFAGEKAQRDDLLASFTGPVAIAFGYGEITEPARLLTEHIHNTRITLSIKGGFLSDRMLTPTEVETLATLPTREVLLAQLLGGMQSPITTLVNCLSGPLWELSGVLQARIKQLEGA